MSIIHASLFLYVSMLLFAMLSITFQAMFACASLHALLVRYTYPMTPSDYDTVYPMPTVTLSRLPYDHVTDTMLPNPVTV